jgi:hypothetical protein
LTNHQVGTIIVEEKVNMVKKVTFYDKDEAIRYQLKMRQEGHLAKILRAPGKYEVVVTGDAPEWESPMEQPGLDDIGREND